MAFHTACPITCRKICFCPHGFQRGKHQLLDMFLGDVTKLEEFLKDPWSYGKPATIQVKVPKLVVAPPPQAPVGDDGGGSSGDGEEVAAVGDDGGGSSGVGEEVTAIASAQTKHVALQKKAAAASMVVVDIARRFESGDVENSTKDVGGEEQALSNVKVMCWLCFSGENERGERARKMMACKICGKKCHLSCLKAWGQHRDLFHWSSWTCPSCRLCEGCQRTGDPNKFIYCKRCDAAYHCYCMQPPQKNISSGPYLCSKHTKCHSCCSNVPGKGPSLRWFLGYTCCDACGKLFLKGNYCHVCLKVYRDSETTPMVCCDICQRWVHCQCDGISCTCYVKMWKVFPRIVSFIRVDFYCFIEQLNGISGTNFHAAFSLVKSFDVNFLEIRKLCNLAFLLVVTQGRLHNLYERLRREGQILYILFFCIGIFM